MSLNAELETFLDELPLPDLAGEIGREVHTPAERVLELLETFSNEARVTLQLVDGRLAAGQRILEVGAGLCFFSYFLKRQGYDVVALEPGLGGYGLFQAAQRVVARRFQDLELPLLECPAEALDACEHGRFDLIFSNNVIEHIPGWRRALEAMVSVLAPGGTMRHTCANYTFPYDPHYGVPVLRFAPQLTRFLYASRIGRNPEIWRSLNFLCHRQVVKEARRLGLAVEFDRGQLYESLNRLGTDPRFRTRHEGFPLTVYRILRATRLLGLLRRLPPGLTTPMTFTVRTGAAA